ncbi:MAG: HAMP domain-containing histidine kinase [Chitinophagaceae bacterium]|nr:HAMP domain-containing histidine kinase [Chitinophagaceae bacterium]
MINYHKIPFVNIAPEQFQEEIDKNGAFYSNVAVWTLLFSLPLFWVLDLLFSKPMWVDYMFLRIFCFALSYLIFWLGNKNKWHYLVHLNLVVALNLALAAFSCGILPLSQALPYYMLASVMVLLLNTMVFWKPIYSLMQVGITYVIIILLYSLTGREDGYAGLVKNGGGVYFIISAFSCLIAHNRYLIVKREIQKNLIIEESNKRLLEQNEMINDQHQVIEEANRRLKQLSDYRQNTLNIMIHDLKNFIGSNQISIDLINRNASNLTTDQKEILSYITMGNEKLHYLSQKLSDSADADTGKVTFNLEEFDIIPEVEKAAVSLVDAASIKQISLQLNLSPTPLFVNLDKIFVRHIFFKLLSNIIRFVYKTSVISIHTSQSDDYCEIEFVNKGKPIGIDKLNEYFNRLNSPNQHEAATSQSGMGFSVSKKMIEDMGGELSYNSNETFGNYFKIKFKLA